MSIYASFELSSLVESLMLSSVREHNTQVLPAFPRFGIMWTANSTAALGDNLNIGEIGKNTLFGNDISLYIGIDHPDVPLSQLSSNGLLINNISDISNYKIHVKTWCNFFDTYSKAGMMLGSDIRNQGDADVDCGNYSSDNLNGLSFFNPNTFDPKYYVKSNSSSVFNLNFNLSSYTLYQIFNHPNNFFFTVPSSVENSCSVVPGYRRSSVVLNSENNNSKSDLNNSLSIFPNPFETEFRIESSSVAIKEIALFDVLGRSMLTEVGLHEKTHLINLNTAPGCYLLKVVLANGEVIYHKMVKSND